MKRDPSVTETCDIVRVLVFPSQTALANSGAMELLERLQRILSNQRHAYVALSGGTTPKPLYRALGDSLKSWNHTRKDLIHWFFSDERAVPPEDSQSNYRMAMEALFAPGAISPKNIHRFQGEDSLHDREARRYEKVLTETMRHPGPLVPPLDIVLLGLGQDGHTASLFPGTTPEEDHHRLTLSVVAEGDRTARLSLSYRMLASAHSRIFLVSGKEKRGILSRALDPAGTLPVQWVLKEAAKHFRPTEFWIDQEARPPGIERWVDLRVVG